MKQVIKLIVGYVRISLESQKDNTTVTEKRRGYMHIVPIKIG